MSVDTEDVRYPWEEPDEEPADSTAAPSLEAQSPPGAVLEPTEHAAPRGDEDRSAEDGTLFDETADSSGAPARDRPIAPKEYYSISEVCDLVDLKPHVLRYWESQFPVLNPSKNRSGNRVYQRKEIKLILLVKHLLYEEKYTIEGAKQKLDQLRRGGELASATARALDAGMLDMLRTELRRLSELLVVPEPD